MNYTSLIDYSSNERFNCSQIAFIIQRAKLDSICVCACAGIRIQDIFYIYIIVFITKILFYMIITIN